MPGMGVAIGRASSQENTGDLKWGTHRSAVRDLLFRRGQRKPVERTDDRPNGLCGDLRVEGRRVYLGVAEQDLDDADVDAIFEKMGGEDRKSTRLNSSH